VEGIAPRLFFISVFSRLRSFALIRGSSDLPAWQTGFLHKMLDSPTNREYKELR
jgi:hypothetical protein